ncbi:MAG: hypothetical protein IK119_06365 [Bacteroidales bacterium]|nr:hypothetical protein [Bacteroidales bacterium]
MLKKLSFFALAAIVAASCSKSEILVPVNVHVNDFLVTIDTFSDTKATLPSAYNDITRLTLAFYSGGTEVFSATQTKGSDGYGTFSLALPMGSYTMVALGYYGMESSPLTLTSPTEASYSGLHALETFAYTQAVNITNTSAVNLNATLDRICAQLQVISSDGKTSNASNIRVSFSAGSKSFNPTTGLALDNNGFSNTVGISAAVGSPSTSKSFLFLTADEETMDVTIETLDAQQNVLYTNTVTDVPFQRNKITKLTGAVYTNPSVGSSLQLNSAWLTDATMNF